MKKHNNQLGINDQDSVEVEEVAYGGWSVWGEVER